MTNSQRMRESAVIISSTMPSAKYSCSGSPLILAKGSTAIEGLSGNGSEEPITEVAVGEVSPPTRYALIGWAMFFTCCSPRSMASRGSFVPMWSRTTPEMQIPPGSARASNRAAILTASPKRLSPCTMISPTWTHGFFRDTGGNFSPAIDAPGATKFGTFALGINDVSSQIIGDFFVATGQQHGFLDSGGR